MALVIMAVILVVWVVHFWYHLVSTRLYLRTAESKRQDPRSVMDGILEEGSD